MFELTSLTSCMSGQAIENGDILQALLMLKLITCLSFVYFALSYTKCHKLNIPYVDSCGGIGFKNG